MLESIFSVDIYRTRIENLEILSQTRRAAHDLDFSVTYDDDRYPGSGTSLTTRPNSNNLHTNSEFALLSEFVEKEAKIYWDLLGYYPNVCPKIWQSWSNITKSSGSINPHNHCRSPLTAVVYLAADKECGNLVLENPMDLIIGGQPIKMPYKNFTRSIEVTTGDVILFPGYLKHFTELNHSGTPRVTFVALLNERGF